MPAQADWVIVRCMDPRLNGPIRRFLEKMRIGEGEYSLIAVPGGPQDINDPHRGVFTKALETISIPLHGAKYALLIQHTDCGAYGGRVECGGTSDADLSHQCGELRVAVSNMKRLFSTLFVAGYVAHINDANTQVDFYTGDRELMFSTALKRQQRSRSDCRPGVMDGRIVMLEAS